MEYKMFSQQNKQYGIGIEFSCIEGMLAMSPYIDLATQHLQVNIQDFSPACRDGLRFCPPESHV